MSKMAGKNWSGGHLCRLPFAGNVMVYLYNKQIFPQIPERPLLGEERVDFIVSFFLSKLLSRVPVGFDQDYKTVGVTIIFLLLFLLLLLLSLQNICGQSRLPQVRWEVLLFNCEGFNTQNTKTNAT